MLVSHVCSYKKLAHDVKPGSQILCADGSIVLVSTAAIWDIPITHMYRSDLVQQNRNGKDWVSSAGTGRTGWQRWAGLPRG